MEIGATIRKFRKERDMTQEEMANRLGVTPSAVNKWENGNSYPDILLLGPIARLLNISLDTLLAFQSELTEAEIKNIIGEVDRRFKESTYEETFQVIKNYLHKYTNCEKLAWQLAVMLDAHRLLKKVTDPEQYDEFILACYFRALESGEEEIRTCGADSLYNFYLRNEQYEEAEKYLNYLSAQSPESKRKQAALYGKMGRTQEAYKAYEELLFSDYQIESMVFNGLYSLAVKEQNLEKAQFYLEKQTQLAKLFDMGEYYEVYGGLELAALKQEEEEVLEIAEKMLSGVEKIGDFNSSPLYEHLEFKKTDPDIVRNLKKTLLKSFRYEESYGFMKENSRWKKMLEKYKIE